MNQPASPTPRTLRIVLVAVGAVILGVAYATLASTAVQAWGNGNICFKGDTKTFPNEQSYYEFLSSHPDAVEGDCAPTTTTTTTAPEVPPSTTQPESSTTAPSPSTSTPTTDSPTTTVAPPSSLSVPPSTPSSTTEILVEDTVPIPPGSCLATGNCPTDDTTETSSTWSPPSPAAPSATSANPVTASSSPTSLPATGTPTDGLVAVAAITLLAGGACALIARRKAS